MTEFEYDAFISHASEDKTTFVEPLAHELTKLGLKVWYDRFSLCVGDSLHDSIELGLSKSRYGIVVFSQAFFVKKWPRKELNGLFAREMAGHKVILPVWHEISHSDILENLPMMADKVALQSSDGVPLVAASLVKEIRPELLTFTNSSNAAALAGQRLAETVAREYPGYAISVTSGSLPSILNRATRPQGFVASSYQDGALINIAVSDPKKLASAPSISLKFMDNGVAKLEEAIRTGKAQSFLIGEFSFHGSTIPLMPAADSVAASTLEMRSNVDSLPKVDVRLEVNVKDEVLRVSLMKLEGVRVGTEELELRLAHPSHPFEMGFVIALGETETSREISFSVSFPGFSFSKVNQYVKFINAIFSGGEFRMYDLISDSLLFRSNLSQNAAWLPSGLGLLIDMVASIEDYFKVSIPFPATIFPEDIESVSMLHCLISGDPIGENINLGTQCLKNTELTARAEDWKKGPAPFFCELEESKAPLHLFGIDIAIPAWVLYTEKVLPENIDQAVEDIRRAPEGSHVSIRFRGLSPTYVRFRDSLEKNAFMAPTDDQPQSLSHID